MKIDQEKLREATKRSFTFLLLTVISLYAGAALWSNDATLPEYQNVMVLITGLFASVTVIIFAYHYKKDEEDGQE
jgi:Ca2+/Na+ antiporter